MMEFRDQDGCRRFFRIEDQLGKASNEALRFCNPSWIQMIKKKEFSIEDYKIILKIIMPDGARRQGLKGERRINLLSLEEHPLKIF